MALSLDCLNQLKLTQAPFDELPSEAFLYTDPLLERLLEEARDALSLTGSVLLVTGPAGSGRSIHLMRLLGILPGRLTLVAFRGREGIPFHVVETTIRHQLGITADELSLSEALGEHLSSGAGIVIAIDDAELLGNESLFELMRLRNALQDRYDNAPHLLLIGATRLDRLELDLTETESPSQVMRIRLRPFNLEQSTAYLLHRLRASGLENPQALLSDDDIESLQARSGGWPKALNELANAWLEARCRDALGVNADALAITKRIRALSAAVQQTEAEPSPSQTKAKTVSVKDAPSAEISSDRDASASTSTVADQKTVAPNKPPANKNKGQPSQPPAKSTAKTPQIALWNRRWFVPAIAASAAIAILVPVIVQLQTEDGIDSTSLLAENHRARRLLEADPEPEPEIRPQPLLSEIPNRAAPPDDSEAPLGSMEPDSTLGSLDDEEPVVESTPPADEVAPDEQPLPEPEEPVAQEPLPDLDADQAWLTRQNPNAYTIQLIALSSLEAASEYVGRHALEDVRYLALRSGERTLIVALVGAFPDRTAAERAYRAFPKAVQTDKPWIRTIKSVQDSL